MTHKHNLNFSGFKISDEGKMKLELLYQNECKQWTSSEYQNTLAVPDATTLSGLSSDGYGLLVLLSYMNGGKPIRSFAYDEGRLVELFTTVYMVNAETLALLTQAGQEKELKRKVARKKGYYQELIDELIEKGKESTFNSIRVVENVQRIGDFISFKFNSPRLVEVHKALIDTILKDELANKTILGQIGVLYGYCYFMFRDSLHGLNLFPKYESGTIPGCDLDDSSYVTMPNGEMTLLGGVTLPLKQHYRQGAWGKLEAVSAMLGISKKTTERHLKSLRQMDVMRSVIVSGNKKNLSVDFTRYNNYGLNHFFNNPNRQSQYKSIKTLWCYGIRFNSF